MRSFDKLKAKLAELFQLDQADLDFGIYRITSKGEALGPRYKLGLIEGEIKQLMFDVKPVQSWSWKRLICNRVAFTLRDVFCIEPVGCPTVRLA